MCGILAIHSDTPIATAWLEEGSLALRHRGPDDDGAWLSANGRVGLVSRRLSIVDLAGGRQPLHAPSCQTHAVVNGELYDYARIRQSAVLKGYRFGTESDSEIVLPLYEQHGLGFAEHLRGEFAVLLWDEKRSRLVAVRDRFGIKPLFYARRGGTIVIASEIKAILATGHRAALAKRALLRHLLVSPGPNETLFEDVWQVPPGHMMIVDGDGIRFRRYWDLDFPEQTADSVHDRVRPDEFREELAEAVGLRLQGDVPACAFLSGGLDSASVLALARQAEPGVRAFTVGFRDAAYDESERAAAIAAFLKTELDLLMLTPEAMADNFERAIWHGETIGDNARGVARLLQSQAVARAGFKVALSGEGADELLGGYLFTRLDFLQHDTTLSPEARQAIVDRISAFDPRFRATLASAQQASVPALDRALGFSPAWMTGMVAGRGRLFRSLLRDDVANETPEDDLVGEFLDLVPSDQLVGRHPARQSLAIWIKSALPNLILAGDRMEMAGPIENRMPFLDHYLFEHVRDLPCSTYFLGGLEKGLLRQAMAGTLPEDVLARPKRAFTAPHATLDLANPISEWVIGQLRDRRSSPVWDLFDTAKVGRLIDTLASVPAGQRAVVDEVLTSLATGIHLTQAYNMRADHVRLEETFLV